MSLPDRYDFATTEPEIYRAWIEAGVFEARSGRSERVGGLAANGVHAVAGAVACRARSVRPTVRARPGLPRPSGDSLVPALPYVAQRRGGGVPGGDRRAVSHRLSGRGPTGTRARRRHDAARDDARRRG